MIKTLVNEELDLSVFIIQGDINIMDILEAIQQCTSLPGWHDAQDVVIDLRKSTGVIALADYDQILEHVLSYGLNTNVKYASIVSTHITAAMTKEWQSLVMQYDMNFEVFFELSEAAKWLGIDDRSLSAALN